MIHCHFIPMDQNRHLFLNLLFIVPSYKGLIKTDNLGKYVTWVLSHSQALFPFINFLSKRIPLYP